MNKKLALKLTALVLTIIASILFFDFYSDQLPELRRERTLADFRSTTDKLCATLDNSGFEKSIRGSEIVYEESDLGILVSLVNVPTHHQQPNNIQSTKSRFIEFAWSIDSPKYVPSEVDKILRDSSIAELEKLSWHLPQRYTPELNHIITNRWLFERNRHLGAGPVTLRVIPTRLFSSDLERALALEHIYDLLYSSRRMVLTRSNSDDLVTISGETKIRNFTNLFFANLTYLPLLDDPQSSAELSVYGENDEPIAVFSFCKDMCMVYCWYGDSNFVLNVSRRFKTRFGIL